MKGKYTVGGYREREICTPARQVSNPHSQSQVTQLRTGGVGFQEAVVSPRGGYVAQPSFQSAIRNHQQRDALRAIYHHPNPIHETPVIEQIQKMRSQNTINHKQHSTPYLNDTSHYYHQEPQASLVEQTQPRPVTLAGLVQQAGIQQSQQTGRPHGIRRFDTTPSQSVMKAGLFQLGTGASPKLTQPSQTQSTPARHQSTTPIHLPTETISIRQPVSTATVLTTDFGYQTPHRLSGNLPRDEEMDELKIRCFEAESRSDKLEKKMAELEKENKMLVAALKAIEDNHIRREAERLVQQNSEIDTNQNTLKTGLKASSETNWSQMMNSISSSQESMLQSLELKSNLSKKIGSHKTDVSRSNPSSD